MKSVKTSFLIGVLLVLTLTGCMSKPQDDAQNGEISKPIAAASPDAGPNEAFQTGVFVDLNTIHDPLLNETIKSSLRITLNSLANKDENAFRSVFVDKQTANAFMYLFGKDYRFEKVGTIMKDNAGRIVVEVRGQVRDDAGTREPNAYYYFVKSDLNKWALGAID